MKSISVFISILLLIISSACSTDNGSHLFILSGQSNMEFLDPSISFIPELEKELGSKNIIVVKDAEDGEPIRRWYKEWKPASGEFPEGSGDLYDRLMNKVVAAISNRKICSVTLIWMQGERDARESHGDVYGRSLQGLIAQFASDLDRDSIFFVIGRLSDFQMNNRNFPHWTMVRDAQVEVAESTPLGRWINTDDLNDGINPQGREIQDDLHYSADGYAIMGQRFAHQALQLIDENGLDCTSHQP